MIRFEGMRARGAAIATDPSPVYRAGLRTAGQVAVDQRLAAMGPAGTDIIDRYRQRC